MSTLPPSGRFLGKYRGVVTDNADPEKLGRVRARVPDVTGSDQTGWALPCAPFTGAGVGFYALPENNACVWIEFEHGDPDYPIWTGGFWGRRDDVPNEAQQQPTRRVELRTTAGHRVVLDERDGITLEASGGQKIVVGANGIEIRDGKGGVVKIDGGRVNVNDGALEVT